MNDLEKRCKYYLTLFKRFVYNEAALFMTRGPDMSPVGGSLMEHLNCEKQSDSGARRTDGRTERTDHRFRSRLRF